MSLPQSLTGDKGTVLIACDDMPSFLKQYGMADSSEFQEIVVVTPSRPCGMSQAHAASRAVEMLVKPGFLLDSINGMAPIAGYKNSERGGLIRESPRRGRNDPCSCGCGKKMKRCPNRI